MGTITVETEECLARALEGHEEAGQDYLRCATPVLSSYLQCLESNIDCEESTGQQCDQTRTTDLASCPPLPADVQAELTACTQ